MVLPVPLYIDAHAVHSANALRSLVDLAAEGQEGVRDPGDLAVRALPTPGGAISVDPGQYVIRNTAAGARRQAYAGLVEEAEQVEVPPTDSSGGRTDLIIARVENPYVVGTGGNWPEPTDRENGPYARIFVVTGIPANTQTHKAINPTWSAIPLARITRPASTGIVTQAHITDLRSMIDLRVERITYITNPPAAPPPVAQAYWTESTPCANTAVVAANQFEWTDFPLQAAWTIPVPSWALGFDLNALVNPQIDGHVWGQMRPVINNGSIVNDDCGIVPSEYDFNYHGGPGPERQVFMIGGTGSLRSQHRGREVQLRLQARSVAQDWRNAHPGRLGQNRGTRVNIWINFKRFPSYNP